MLYVYIYIYAYANYVPFYSILLHYILSYILLLYIYRAPFVEYTILHLIQSILSCLVL